MMPHCIACRIECPWDNLDADSGGYDERQAVCGVDGKTYRSACDINRMICKIGRSIAVAYPGPCRGMYFGCGLLSADFAARINQINWYGKPSCSRQPANANCCCANLTTINKEPQFCI